MIMHILVLSTCSLLAPIPVLNGIRKFKLKIAILQNMLFKTFFKKKFLFTFFINYIWPFILEMPETTKMKI